MLAGQGTEEYYKLYLVSMWAEQSKVKNWTVDLERYVLFMFDYVKLD